MKKIFLTIIAVTVCAVTTMAQCVYPTDNVTINFKRKTPGLLEGEFTIDGSGHKVSFAQGNLQYNSDTQKWQLASKQYTRVGNAAGNTSVGTDGLADDNGVADLFGWVGYTSTWTNDLKKHGLTSSKATGAADGYGTSWSENLKSDWGTVMGSGWRTLSSAQWAYILNSRTGDEASTVNGSANICFAKATVNSVAGIIIFPDGETFASSEFTIVGSLNTANAAYTTTTCTSSQWEALEEKGCVFLPVAGYRIGAEVSDAAVTGRYWSSSHDTSSREKYATLLEFTSSALTSSQTYPRSYGMSVRLVQDVE